MGLRIKKPLDKKAVAKANQAIKNKTVPPGRKLSPTSKSDADLRHQWMNAYIAAGGPLEEAPVKKPPADTMEPCPLCGKGILAIKVSDDKGNPRTGVEVNVEGIGKKATSDKGYVEFKPLVPGTYKVTANKDRTSSSPNDSAATAEKSVDVMSDQTTQVSLKLTPICIIKSEAVATSPVDRARKRIGVGEEIELTIDSGSATWAITSGKGKIIPAGNKSKVTFTADETAGNVTITANSSCCQCNVSFTVVEPAGWSMKRKLGTNLKHKNGRPDCGWYGTIYVQPNDVNFYNVKIREKDSSYKGTGSYIGYNGDKHGNYPGPEFASAWLSLTKHSIANGTEMAGKDDIYTGDPGSGVTGTAPPFNVGAGYFPIIFQWKVGASGSLNNFGAVRQEDEIIATGKCISKKGGNTESTMYNDPTSTR